MATKKTDPAAAERAREAAEARVQAEAQKREDTAVQSRLDELTADKPGSGGLMGKLGNTLGGIAAKTVGGGLIGEVARDGTREAVQGATHTKWGLPIDPKHAVVVGKKSKFSEIVENKAAAVGVLTNDDGVVDLIEAKAMEGALKKLGLKQNDFKLKDGVLAFSDSAIETLGLKAPATASAPETKAPKTR